ncbi:MAG: competence/damage-inducible protein A [Gemmatimonadota bacterium]
MKRGLTTVEIVAIGDELLSGATIDSNAARIAEELEPVGLRVIYKATVPDSADAVAAAVRSALQRSGAVITTGGLGPTKDDLTKSAVAEVFGVELEFREDLWSALQQRWTQRGKIPRTNRTQAEVPAGARVLPNPRGTAPGLALEDERLGVCVMLPGPPHEMQHILVESVVPYLAAGADPEARRPFRRHLRTAGIAESAIAEKMADKLDDLPLEVAYLPEIAGNDLRLTAWAADGSEAEALLDEAVKRIRDVLGLHVYADGAIDLADVVGDLLLQAGMTVAVAESCTAGLVGARLTERPGASGYFWGGLIAYDDRAKIELLGVSEQTLRRHGAVSQETAREMAEGACSRSGADAAMAVTGIAGPSGGTTEKPVGTVWLAVRMGGRTVAKRRHYPGTRDMVRIRAAQGSLDLLRRTLLGEP